MVQSKVLCLKVKGKMSLLIFYLKTLMYVCSVNMTAWLKISKSRNTFLHKVGGSCCKNSPSCAMRLKIEQCARSLLIYLRRLLIQSNGLSLSASNQPTVSDRCSLNIIKRCAIHQFHPSSTAPQLNISFNQNHHQNQYMTHQTKLSSKSMLTLTSSENLNNKKCWAGIRPALL